MTSAPPARTVAARARSAVTTAVASFAETALRATSAIVASPSPGACTVRTEPSRPSGTPARALPSRTSTTSAYARSAATSPRCSRAAAPGRSRHQPSGREPTTFAPSTISVATTVILHSAAGTRTPRQQQRPRSPRKCRGVGRKVRERSAAGDGSRHPADAGTTEVDPADRVGGEEPGPGRRSAYGGEQPARLVQPGPQLVDLVLHGQDPADAFEVDPLVLAQPLHQPQLGDVARRVASAALGGPPGRHQAHPVVGAQGLRMHPGQRGGDRYHEARRIMVDARRHFARHSFLLSWWRRASPAGWLHRPRRRRSSAPVGPARSAPRARSPR